MDWYTDPILCQRRIDDLAQQPAYAVALTAFGDGETLTAAQEKLLRQMDRFTERLAQLKGLTQVAAGKRERPWEAAVDLDALPGSDRHELTRNDHEGKDKGLRKQYQETQAHYVAHASSQLALADAQQAMAGVALPDAATFALEFLVDVAEKGVARAKARAKILALVSDKGPEVGWKVCEKLERKSYADDEEDEKAIRKAEKEVKAEKLLAAQAAAAKGRARQLAGNPRNGARPVAPGAPPLPLSPLQPGRGAGLQCWNCQQWGHHQNDCPQPRREGGGRGRGRGSG